MVTPSQEFSVVFSHYFDGEVYESVNDPLKWVVEVMGDWYDEEGLTEDIHGRKLSSEEIRKVFYSMTHDKIRSLLEDIELMVKKQEEENRSSIITAILNLFPEYQKLSNYDGKTAILKHQNTHKKVFLKTFNQYAVNESISYVVLLYRMLSHLGYTVPVYQSGILSVNDKNIGYVISKYLPITLTEVLDDGDYNQDEISEKVNNLIDNLWKLQIHNLDIHSDNFLFDPSTHKIYAIDFDTTSLS